MRLAAETLGAEVGAPLRRTVAFVHGTTIGTNTLVQRRGARTGFLMTRGPRADDRDRTRPLLVVCLVLRPQGLLGVVCARLSLIFGCAGQLSLTQAAFHGIGACAAALLTTRFGLSFWVVPTAAALLPGSVAAGIGLPILRLRHDYLADIAMATLAFSEIMMVVVFEQEVDITGGPTGIVNLPVPSVLGLRLDTPVRYYHLVWGLAILVLWFSHNLVRGQVGRALRAIGENEVAAGAMGVNVPALKGLMFVLSAVYAGLAGALYTLLLVEQNPDAALALATRGCVLEVGRVVYAGDAAAPGAEGKLAEYYLGLGDRD